MLSWTIHDSFKLDAMADVERLWRSDPSANPFFSPHFLAVMSEAAKERGQQPVIAVGADERGRIRALWPLRLDRSGVLGFLPEGYSDERSCLADMSVSAEAAGGGFGEAIRAAKPRAVALRNVPDGLTAEAAQRGLRELGWRVDAFAATPRPVLTAGAGGDPSATFAKEINGHSRVRGYANKLSREPGYAFEAYEDDHDLAEWAEDFCHAHDWRWAKTTTPSAYASAVKRQLFGRVLAAWHADGAGVRFSIRAGGRRIAFVAAVRTGRRLVYHHVAVSPAGEDFRAGHVMIRLIGLWMAERGLTELDFGVGDEAYKFRYSNADWTLWKVYGAPGALSATMAKAWAERKTRNSQGLEQAWRRFGPAGAIGQASAKAADVRARAKVAVRYFRDESWPGRFAAVAGALKATERELLFRAVGAGQPLPPRIRPVTVFEVLEMVNDIYGLTGRGRSVYHRLFDSGVRVYGVDMDGKLAHFECVSLMRPDQIPPLVGVEEGKPVWQIMRCLTRPEHRGQGLYSMAIRGITGSLPAGEVCVMWTFTWNHASIRGILKAGYEPFASRSWKGKSPNKYERYRAEAPHGVPLGDWVLRNLP